MFVKRIALLSGLALFCVGSEIKELLPFISGGFLFQHESAPITQCDVCSYNLTHKFQLSKKTLHSREHDSQ